MTAMENTTTAEIPIFIAVLPLIPTKKEKKMSKYVSF